MEKKVLKYITDVEVVIYLALMVILMVILIFSTLELAYLIIDALFFDDTMLKLETRGILASFEFFLLILIGLELMETIKSFLETRKIQVEIVIILAIIAVARKIIIIDPMTISNDILLGIGVVIFALTAGYFFIKKADSLTPEHAAGPKKE